MSSSKLGIKDFIAMTDEFHSEWSLFAVESTIKDVVDFLASYYRARNLENNVSIRLQTISGTLQEKLEGGNFASAIPVVKTYGNSWALVYSAVFHGNISASNDAGVSAKELNTRAIALVREDTSEYLGYELFDKGERIERAGYVYGEERISWKSKLRRKPRLNFRKQPDVISEPQQPQIILSPYEQPQDKSQALWMPGRTPVAASNQRQLPSSNLDEVDEFEEVLEDNWSIWCDFIDGIFADLGVYLPAFYAICKDSDVSLVVETCSEECIEQVVLIHS
jgi:hypothetical protein